MLNANMLFHSESYDQAIFNATIAALPCFGIHTVNKDGILMLICRRFVKLFCRWTVPCKPALLIFFLFLVGYVEERLWWPIQSPNKGDWATVIK